MIMTWFFIWQFVYLWLAQCHLCLISVFYQWPLFDVWCLISKYLWKLPVLSTLLPVSEANFPMGFRKLPQQLPVRLYYSPCNTRATWPTATATCLNLFWSLIDPFDVVIWKRQRDLDISVREGIEKYFLEGRKRSITFFLYVGEGFIKPRFSNCTLFLVGHGER